MARSFSLKRYLQIQTAVGPSFSPDGRFLVFRMNTTGVPQLWQVPVTGGWPTQLTFSKESVRGGSYHPRSHQLIFSQDLGGNERTQLYLLHGTGGGTDHQIGEGWFTTDLTRSPRAIHYFGGWSRDGEHFAFTANRVKVNRFDIYVQKLGESKARLLCPGPGGLFNASGWSPNGKFLLAHRVESNFNQHLHVIEVATGKIRRLTRHQGNCQYRSPSWAADGKSIYCVSTHGGRDLPALAQIDVESGKTTFLEQPNHEVSSVMASSKGRWLAWMLNVQGRSELHIRDLKTGKNLKVPALPLGVISGVLFSPDESQLVFALEGPRHNANIWTWDLKAAKPKQITFASRAGIPVNQFVEPELIQYPTFDKRKIPAWFYKPKSTSDELPPVIVYPHGGPESQFRPRFGALFQYFLDRGYAVLAPNVRGSTGYGTTYQNLDNTTKRMDAVKDLAHAAFWLRDQKCGDPNRLAVFGASYGGFMTLASVTHYPNLWAAGIDMVGIANFITFLEKTGPYRRSHREAEYGNLRQHREFLRSISPINHVDKIKCPMMVIHGKNDPRVPIEESEQIVAALRKRKIPVEYLRYADEGHGLGKLHNRLDAYPKMAQFLDRYVMKRGKKKSSD